MAKSKTKWKGFKRIFGKPSNARPQSGSKLGNSREQDVLELDPNEEESFVVEPIAKNVYLFKPTQNQTFEVDSTQEENIEPADNYNFVIEPTKEYKIFGLEPDATDAEVKKRYRKLVKQNHPDAGGDPKEFMKIRKAYTKIMEARNED